MYYINKKDEKNQQKPMSLVLRFFKVLFDYSFYFSSKKSDSLKQLVKIQELKYFQIIFGSVE